MERLTKTSDSGEAAFTFDLYINCLPSEAKKILNLATKLKEYEDLEEQGRLIKLPCKVGDNVYIVKRYGVEEAHIIGITEADDVKRDNKIYISGAITGINNYMERFNMAEEQLKSQGFSVINPARVNAALPEDTTTYEEYMKMSMTMLEMCNYIYMLKGWEKSPGANREYGYALASDMTIIWG